jgi:phosphatidylglycerophosphate synthase
MKNLYFAQKRIYLLIGFIRKLLIKHKVTPNMITSFGLAINIFFILIFITDSLMGGRVSLSCIGWGSGLILFARLFDMQDAQPANRDNRTSRFVYVFDSVLNRPSEFVLILSICFYLVARPYLTSYLILFIALTIAMTANYIRMWTEGLNFDFKVNWVQHHERRIIMCLFWILASIVMAFSGGNHTVSSHGLTYIYIVTISISIFSIAFITLLANITPIQRPDHCSRQLNKNNSK